MKAKDFIPATKPRNFVAKNQQTAGAGAHRDKKKEQKQGDVKHKNKQFEQGVAEATGDKPFDSMMKNIKKGTAKQATADRREARKQSQQRARDAFGPSPAANLGIRKPGVAEASDWGEPREILEDVLQTLEREVEWPLTEVMDPKEVRQLLSPIVRAVNDKLLSMDRDGNQ